jgi:hypothetical protein
VPAALQCPDCGHQEMLDNLGGVTTFRCGGCGRALKVPAQFREAGTGGPGSRPPAPGEPTQAMPRVRPESGPPAESAPTPPVVPAPVPTPAPVPPMPVAGPPVAGPPVAGLPRSGPPAGPPTGRSPIAEASAPLEVDGSARPVPIPPEGLRPPLVLRLALWAIALPLGSLIVFTVASWLKILTKSQLEDTFLLAGWGRFVPIARLLPFCALVTALIVQLGVFGLEQLRLRNLRNRPPRRRGGSGARPGPTRPHAPGGQAQPGTNGSRSRDRVIS